jgi:hypothetical protein
MRPLTKRASLAAMISAALTFGGKARAHASADDEFDRLLERYVVAGPDGVNRVRYRAWKDNRPDRVGLDRYVRALEGARPATLARPAAFAYWANLYNAVTLQFILEHYPVASIREIRSRTLDPRGLIGPWRTQRIRVAGRRLSLDGIEHGILRREWRDARVHYAVNCASIGCPNLPRRAWRAETLDADLDAAARAYVNHPRGATVGADGGLRVSSIYHWYQSDFGGAEAGVIAHLRRHAAPDLRQALGGVSAIADHGYDWSLNDAGP